jgi:hypothetical protein
MAKIWSIMGVQPVYKLAVRYLKRVEGVSTGIVVNTALRYYLEQRYPRMLERARTDMERAGLPNEGHCDEIEES